MYYDLNVPYISDKDQLQKTLAFLEELGYNVVALNHIISGKLPAELKCGIPDPLPFRPPPKLRILRRCTVILSDPSQNHRLASLAAHYDLLAIRPTSEKALVQMCQHTDASLISVDLTVRHPFHFKHSLVRAAINRGVRFEMCYAPAILSSDMKARRNLITNATELIRVTGGRGLVFSSEAKSAVGLRAPADLVNWAVVWGVNTEKGKQAVEREARSVVTMAEMKKTSWRGVIDVVDGGAALPRKAEEKEDGSQGGDGKGKRKAEAQMSRRQAKLARREAAKKARITQTEVDESAHTAET